MTKERPIELISQAVRLYGGVILILFSDHMATTEKTETNARTVLRKLHLEIRPITYHQSYIANTAKIGLLVLTSKYSIRIFILF